VAWGGGLEGRELDAVPVDLADVEVRAYLGHFGRRDVVCGAPDALGRFVLGCVSDNHMQSWLGGGQSGAHVVGQCVPVRAVDERDDAAGGFWGASVVLTLEFRQTK
jgi:hypothetical protein